MHFTYRVAQQEDDLHQGDILKRTPALDDLLRAFHPYYARDGYTHFLVLTQSCDLVRRGGAEPSSPYINLCAVRPLEVALMRVVTNYQKNDLLKKVGALQQSHRVKVEQFLERLLNNNHTEYFYLHSEPSIGITENSCAFLRLSVALRTADSYAACRASRIASLSKGFEPKLGWLIGNIFSRVGTDDWAPEHFTVKDYRDTIARLLDEYVLWVEADLLKAARAKISSADIESKDADELRELLSAIIVPAKKDQVVDAVVDVLLARKFVDEKLQEKVRVQLLNSPLLSSLLK